MFVHFSFFFFSFFVMFFFFFEIFVCFSQCLCIFVFSKVITDMFTYFFIFDFFFEQFFVLFWDFPFFACLIFSSLGEGANRVGGRKAS